MFQVLLAIIAILAMFVVPKYIPTQLGIVRNTARLGLFAMAVFMALNTSYVYVDSDETGHLQKIYGADELQNGRIIAADGEKGYQAQILRPGFHFIPFVSVFYDVEPLPVVGIPAGYYGRIETRDGVPLPGGAIMAKGWSDTEFQNMLNAEYFLNNAGEKGLQTAVLKPGRYPLNLYLYKITVSNGTEGYVYDMNGRQKGGNGVDTQQTVIPAGSVGVVTSKIQSLSDGECVLEKKVVVDATGKEISGALSVDLVKKGCRGIWSEAIRPGGYFLNNDAYTVTLVNTRVQTWRYEGGYDSRSIDLDVSAEDGKITQTPNKSTIHLPEDAADAAISAKVEGWTVHQNLRAVVQVTPENAPIVVAAVGGLSEVEDRIITPAIISEVRDVIGGVANLPELDDQGRRVTDKDGNLVMKIRSVRILDLIENRDFLQTSVDNNVREHGAKAGVNIMEVRFGNPDIPPEMLVARKREQLATQLKKAYAEERKAQVERQSTEEAKARADKQSQIVQAEIKVQVAEQVELERAKLGNAEKAYLTALAQGEKVRTEVLGADKVMMLNIVDKVLNTLENKPELVAVVGKLVPQVMVTGGGGGFEGPAAIIGNLMGKKVAQTPAAQ